MLLKVVVLFLYSFGNINCARILGIIPTASFAHQATFQPFWRELVHRGHQLTLITTNPIHNPDLKNLTEIDISFIYNIYKEQNVSAFLTDDTKGYLQVAPKVGDVLRLSQEAIFESQAVRNLIDDKNLQFDLVIGEALTPFMLGFGWRYQCPIIGIASMDVSVNYHDAMGNIVHPVLNPDDNLPIENPEDMTFLERLMSVSFNLAYKYLYYTRMYPKTHAQAQKYFGQELPPLEDIARNLSMLFVTTHPIFHPPRPVNPSTISIGTGMHLAEPKPLPKAWQDYLDSAKEGVIYFSLGTNVNLAYTNKQFLSSILSALGEVPYQVIIKSEQPISNLPKNIKLHHWVPQQDLLRHRNIKLFITQGGLQSLQESLYVGVPVVGIPFLGDQYKNVIRMEQWGYGIRMKKNELTKETFKNAILEVIGNPKYRLRAQELGRILMDQEIPGLQRAIYWTEYVIRYNGAPHLRSIGSRMPIWKFYMLDVLAVLAAILFGILILFFVVFRCIVKRCLRCCSKRSNKKKNKRE